MSRRKSSFSQIFFYVCVFLMVMNLNESKIFVVSPNGLASKFNERIVEGTLSKFGRIPYGFSIVGNIYYKPDSNGINTGCNDTNFSKYDEFMYSIDDVPVYMLDRGDCTFVKKVENAELNGALAVIIVDNVEEKITDKVMMADDGKGNNITIPAILISNHDGNTIKKYLTQNPNEVVVIEMDFEMVLIISLIFL